MKAFYCFRSLCTELESSNLIKFCVVTLEDTYTARTVFPFITWKLNNPLQSCVWTMEIEHRKNFFPLFLRSIIAIYRTISNWQFGVLFSQKWVLQSVVECVRWLNANTCEVSFSKSLDFQLWKLKLRGNKNYFFSIQLT